MVSKMNAVDTDGTREQIGSGDSEIIICPECRKEISKQASKCPNCGFPLDSCDLHGNGDFQNIIESKQSANDCKSSPNEHSKRGKYITMLSIGIVLFLVGIGILSSSRFTYSLENYKYYEMQYKDNLGNALDYGGTGIIGGTYAFVASSWRDLYNEARFYLIIYGSAAVVSFTVGAVLVFKGSRGVRGKRDGSGNVS